MESRDGHGSPAADRAAIRARFISILNAKLAELLDNPAAASDPQASNVTGGGAETSTVGTGSVVAIGCSAIALVVLAIGILVLVLTRWT